MERIPGSSRIPQSETSPLVYHEMQNGYSERPSHLYPSHMNHSQSPLSIRTNYAPPTPHFKVQMWQQPIYDSGVQSMQHSQSASVMSFPAGSEMSAMSMMDQAELTDIQQQKFDNIQMGSSAIPQLLQVMRDGTESEIYQALVMIQNIAKLDQQNDREANIRTTDVINTVASYLRGSSSEKITRSAVSALFQICNGEPGLSLLLSSIENGDGEIVRLLTNKIEELNPSINKYAILTLHSLLSDQERRQKCLDIARASGTLRNITNTLRRDQSEKLLSVAVDILRILCEDNKAKQSEFISLNGIPILLHILRVQQYENLLKLTTTVFKQLCNSFGSELVKHQVPIALSEQLDHPSQRLVINSLETLRNLSDVCTREQNQTEILRNLIRLLGSNNPKITLFTVQTLGNMSANNATNKAFLESHNIVRDLLTMMHRNNAAMNADDQRNRMTSEELNDAILSILRHLCCGHPKAENVQKLIFQKPGIFFDQLRTMRPILLKETLQLLNRLTNHDDNLPLFKSFNVLNDHHMYIGFVEQIVHILRVSCNQIVMENIEIERVQVSELVTSCLSILESLCRDRVIFENTVSLLKTHSSEFQGHVFLPIFLLQQNIIDNFPMKRAALSLILTLIPHTDIVSIFYAHCELQSCLTHYIGDGNRELAVLAERACRAIGQRVVQPVMNCPPYRDRAYSGHGHAYEGSMYQQSGAHHLGQPANYSHHMNNTHVDPRASPVPEPMEGAGEQFPEMACIDDPCLDNPFATVFDVTAHTSPHYSSPNTTVNDVMMNSPSQNQWNSMNPSSSTSPHASAVYQRQSQSYPPDPAHQQWNGYNNISYGHNEMAPYINAYESNRRPGIPGADLSSNAYHSAHPPPTYYHGHPSHNQYYNRRESKHNT